MKPRSTLPLMWLCMGVAGCATLLWCMSAWSAWRSAHAATTAQLEAYARYESLAARQPAIQAAATAYAGYLHVSTSDDEALHQLLTTVEHAATQTGLQVQSLAPRPTQRAADTATFAVELECSASPEALARFLHTLAGAPAVLRLERFRINPAPQPRTLQAQLLITYTQLL